MTDFYKLSNGIKNSYIRVNESLHIHSTMKVGGVARYAAFPQTLEALCSIVALADELEIKNQIIGNGSNVVFSDGIYDGIIIFTKNLRKIEKEDNYITAECGVNLITLSNYAKNNSLSGVEFLCGIPGTVGGAIYMNAGAYGHSIGKLVIESICYSQNKIVTFSNEMHCFKERYSALQNSDAVLLQTKLKLDFDTIENISERMNEYSKKRIDSQPLSFPSAGSVFRSLGNVPVWSLIDKSGLRGVSVGGAQVSEKHAGFIINKGNATSNDIETLVKIIQEKVYNNFGINLEPEIVFIK